MIERIVALMLIVGLGFWSCEEPDTTPPTVSITTRFSGSISEIVTISVMVNDDSGIEKVELWIDGVNTNITDDTEPYELFWNTSSYEDSSAHVIVVRVYDTSGNTADSQPVTLTVDNTLAVPTAVDLTVLYSSNSFIITWTKNSDEDFSSYSLYESDSEDQSVGSLIFESENPDDTSHTISGISENTALYYWVTVEDTVGLRTISEIGVGTSTHPLPTEFPLYEDAGWVYTRYFYADTDDYNNYIPDTLYNDTLFILTDIDEDGYYGYSWDLNSYYSLVKNYDNKFISYGSHNYNDDTTYIYELPSIWASYDEFYDTTGYVNDYGYFADSRTEVVDTLFGTPYETYKHRWDVWNQNDYVNLEGYAKFTVENEDDDYFSRVLMIEKLNDTALQNALNIAREQVSRLPNYSSNNFINARHFHGPAFGLNH